MPLLPSSFPRLHAWSGAHAARPNGLSGASRIVDIDMPFGSMVTFMVKWAIATIPAFILLFLIGAMLIALFGGLGLLAGLAAT